MCSFRFVLFMVFEIQGFKLNNTNKKKKKKQKNLENELFVIISVVSDVTFTIF